MKLEVAYTPNECFLTPALIICAFSCETPECPEIHGWGIVVHWLWWGFAISHPTTK